jgi:hypothetical protein
MKVEEALKLAEATGRTDHLNRYF